MIHPTPVTDGTSEDEYWILDRMLLFAKKGSVMLKCNSGRGFRILSLLYLFSVHAFPILK